MKNKLLFILSIAFMMSVTNFFSLDAANEKNGNVQTTRQAKFIKPVKSAVKRVETSIVRPDFKVVSTIQKGKSELQMLQSKDGAISRKLIFNDDSRLQRNLSTSPLMKQQAAVDTSFYESFEAYADTANHNWIPTNWFEENRTGNTYVAGTTNLTWFARNVGGAATDGSNIAWINYNNASVSRDEWLISPAFTPAPNDYLSFDLYYSPFWMYFDAIQYGIDGTIQYNFTKPTTTMQVMITTDNGANWTKIWDAHNYVNRYDEASLINYQNAFWNTFNTSMANYVGQSVKIAFRYFGKNGDSMGLDNIGVRQLKPQAKYGRPQGYFYLGFTPDYYNANADLMLGAPFQNDIWKNNSNQDSQEFMWTFEDQHDPKATFTTPDVAPTVTYPAGFFGMPSLKAKSGAYENTYKWGTATGGSFFLSGGSNVFDWGTVGAGNYDLNGGIANYSFTDGDYVFGTGPNKTVDGIANYFEKPVHPYLLDSLWINLGTFNAPAGTIFKLRIRKVDETGDFSTILATATCTTEDVTQPQAGYFNMPFKGFITYDSLLDLDVTNDYLEIKDAIMVEMYGFNKTGISLSAYSQVFEKSGESNGYVFYNHYSSGRRLLLNSTDYVGESTSLLFNLAVTYPYLVPDSYEFVAPTAGGSKTFTVSSFVAPADWTLENPLPSWLTQSNTYDAQTGAITYTLTAQALPVGTTGRGTWVNISSPGVKMDINVTQGDYTGVETVKAMQTTVITKSQSFELNYSSDFRDVMLFNVAGQVVGSYTLPLEGSFSIPVANLNKGVYFLHFSGKGTQTVKVMKY
ncbi:MAG: choice-of-anchor J domain-containing protein [Bacteroidales bacterium]|nr:choice-of-anchor J domain-containing protein [Bacteroidales bacterium]